MEELLKQILTKLDGVDNRLGNIETKAGKLDDMDNRLGNLETKVDKIDDMDVRLGNIETKVDKIDDMDVRLGNIETKAGKLDGVDARLGNLETKVDKIDASQVRMETELTEKVRGLFDARAVSLDYFASIKNTLARIEASQDSFRHMLYNVEGKQREQERELRLLRVEQK